MKTNGDLMDKRAKTLQLKQYRKCGSCRARTWQGKCDLGFAVDSHYQPKTLGYRPTPAEPCYKPLTVLDYMTCINMRILGGLK